MRRGVLLCLLACGLASPAHARDAAERAYAQGRYVESARDFYRQARAGRALAETYLGYQYQYGLGVPQSYEEAALWYVCAAEQGEPTAQFYLGQLQDRGQGVPEDPVEAGKWMDLAAAHAPAAKRAYWASMRDIVASKMRRDEWDEARRRALAWAPSHVCNARLEAEALALPTRKYRGSESDRER